MAFYDVGIKETGYGVLAVEADSVEQAQIKALEQIGEGDYEITNFNDAEISSIRLH